MPRPALAPDSRLNRHAALQIRRDLGLSRTQLAAVLLLNAETGAHTVRGWETGKRPVSGPTARALQALAAGWRPKDWTAALKAAETWSNREEPEPEDDAEGDAGPDD